VTHFAASWQLLLADLSLILFLSALAAIPAMSDADRVIPDAGHNTEKRLTLQGSAIAPAQSLYRDRGDGPSFARWLSERPRDPRAAVTVFARHSGGDADAQWDRARELSEIARAEGYAVRIIVSEGASSEMYVSLAYDWRQ